MHSPGMENKTVSASRVEISRLMRPQDGNFAGNVHGGVLLGTSSMEVGISIVAENPRDPGSGRRTNRSFITMVAVDDAARPTPVPGLVYETAEDQKWRCESELRKDLRRHYREQIDTGTCAIGVGRAPIEGPEPVTARARSEARG